MDTQKLLSPNSKIIACIPAATCERANRLYFLEDPRQNSYSIHLERLTIASYFVLQETVLRHSEHFSEGNWIGIYSSK
jgi:hypothetical protein